MLADIAAALGFEAADRAVRADVAGRPEELSTLRAALHPGEPRLFLSLQLLKSHEKSGLVSND